MGKGIKCGQNEEAGRWAEETTYYNEIAFTTVINPVHHHPEHRRKSGWGE